MRILQLGALTLNPGLDKIQARASHRVHVSGDTARSYTHISDLTSMVLITFRT